MFTANKFTTLLLFLLLHFTNGLYNPHPHEHEHHHPPPHYEYGYSVHDEFTGDIKDHHEERHGDHVEGRYSLVEPTGERRVVKYHADDLHGFNAEVHCEGHHHPPPAVHGPPLPPLPPPPPPPPPPPALVHPPHPHPEPHSHHEHHHEFHHEHHQEQHHDHHSEHHPHPHPHSHPHPEPFKAKLLPIPIALGFHSPALHPLLLMHHFH